MFDLKHTSYQFLTAYQVLIPKGKDGSVEVSVKLGGYNEAVLAKNDVKNAVSIIELWLFFSLIPSIFLLLIIL